MNAHRVRNLDGRERCGFQQELGLIEEQEGRWLPVPVTAKQDLASAPVLQKLAELAKQA